MLIEYQCPSLTSYARYEAVITSSIIKILIGIWYLYSLVATASYSGALRSFMINPGLSPALGLLSILDLTIIDCIDLVDNLQEVVDSGLPWGLILYGEEEEKLLEASTDPVLSAIWKVDTFITNPS